MVMLKENLGDHQRHQNSSLGINKNLDLLEARNNKSWG